VQPPRRPPASPVLFPWFPLLVLWAAGCSGAGEATELGQIEFFCETVDCGGNSPVVAGTPFHQLSKRGEYNDEGFRVVALRKGASTYRLDVFRDRLRGLDKKGNVALAGANLQNATIELEKGGEQFFVHILQAHTPMRFWIGEDDPIWTYRLAWSFDEVPSGRARDVCPLVAPYDDWLGAHVEAMFFEGDLYDPQSKTVTAIWPDTGGWFNVACAGSAPAKLHATRHTWAGSDDDHQSSLDHRQAMLKMYTADYCGTGKSFTTIGEELGWQNAGDWNAPVPHWQDALPAEPVAYESVWSSTGALCLDIPRLGDGGDDDDIEAEIDDILAECGEAHPLPPCSELEGFPDDLADPRYVVSADPTPDQ
jgi:hypothetical protein